MQQSYNKHARKKLHAKMLRYFNAEPIGDARTHTKNKNINKHTKKQKKNNTMQNTLQHDKQTAKRKTHCMPNNCMQKLHAHKTARKQTTCN